MLDEQPAVVLVVEDEALVALVIEEALIQAGYTVCGTAATPARALALAARHQPDLAVVDVRLAAGADGMILAEALAAQGPIGILYATANPTEVRLRARVGHGCLSKPFEPSWLVSALRFVQRSLASPGHSGAAPPGFVRLQR